MATCPYPLHSSCSVDALFAWYKLLVRFRTIRSLPDIQRHLELGKQSHIELRELSSLLFTHDKIRLPPFP